MIKHISVVMIVKNGERTIEKSLDSLLDFEDIVVYDNGSTDSTLSLVKKYDNVNLIQGDFAGFGETKKKATAYAQNNWILSLDCDEVLDKELIETLKAKKLDENYVYLLNFNTFYKNRQVRYCGWSGQKIKRIFNKKITNYNDDRVHEKIIDGHLKNEEIKGNVLHYSYLSVSDFIQKTDMYSQIYAVDNAGRKKASPLKAVVRSLYFFIKNYIFKLGFLDGYVGLLVCYSGASGVFYKYLKLYEANKRL